MADQKKLYGLIGFPVRHSFSPAMHNAAFAACGIPAEYRLLEIPPDRLMPFLRGEETAVDTGGQTVSVADFSGFNVTIPHKEAALTVAVLTGQSEGVREIGAVNTLERDARGVLFGYNTDWMGFSRDLRERGVTVDTATTAAVIGAGGGARAVCYVLRRARAVYLFDVDTAKTDRLAASFREQGVTNLRPVASVEALRIEERDLLVNASPVGMKPTDPLLAGPAQMHPGLFVYDLIYTPAETPLVRRAREHGLSCANGLDMLLYQGAYAFERWTGKTAPIAVMRQALAERMGR